MFQLVVCGDVSPDGKFYDFKRFGLYYFSRSSKIPHSTQPASPASLPSQADDNPKIDFALPHVHDAILTMHTSLIIASLT